MSIYKDWTDMAVNYVKTRGEQAFWGEYSEVEKKIYKAVLGDFHNTVKGSVESLSAEFGVQLNFFVGFLDGINESLVNEIDMESLEKNTNVELNIDFEKLFYNMIDSKAEHLYSLPEWDAILTKERRKEIRDNWRKSKIIIKPKKIGRNDPCPCGSGKKYKNCCGKNK